eukprot:TRINITY_DN55260_c0_g1_i1.p1 TRINITY_DN55260_c0_g1~~TRINITY_DN55260_c0_g1_i1.p1  ORF type:complete len:508 (-),score=60.83 TRINITY_DN55260_c0_g1_i1:77-1513(-)
MFADIGRHSPLKQRKFRRSDCSAMKSSWNCACSSGSACSCGIGSSSSVCVESEARLALAAALERTPRPLVCSSRVYDCGTGEWSPVHHGGESVTTPNGGMSPPCVALSPFGLEGTATTPLPSDPLSPKVSFRWAPMSPLPTNLLASPMNSSCLVGNGTPTVHTPCQRQALTPSYMGAPSPSHPSGGASGSGSCYRAFPPTLPALLSSPNGAGSLSTPAKRITIATPMRPCPRQKEKEIQDDIEMAVEAQSVQLLRASLKRCHACPGDHPVHEAARQANVPALRLLLSEGKHEPNARCLCMGRGWEFPLQIVASSPMFLDGAERSEAAELLLRARACPNPPRSDADANRPLHDAVRRSDLSLVSVLLKHAANPNAVNGVGETPLNFAVRLGPGVAGFAGAASQIAIAEVLLQGGASPFSVDLNSSLLLDARTDRELYELLRHWSNWWRRRALAWIWSRGSGHPLCGLLPELVERVASFL